MNRRFNTPLNTRARACLYGARVLRRDRAQSACSGRGAFLFICDVLGGLALFVMLFGVAIFGG